MPTSINRIDTPNHITSIRMTRDTTQEPNGPYRVRWSIYWSQGEWPLAQTEHHAYRSATAESVDKAAKEAWALTSELLLLLAT